MSQLEISKLIKTVPRSLPQEEQRVAFSVATGYFSNKSLKECISYYSLNKDIATKWWNSFGFEKQTITESKSKKKKAASFKDFINSNVSRSISVKELSEELNISLPTAYKYVSENRSYFKKIGRGKYEIIDYEKERSSAKK